MEPETTSTLGQLGNPNSIPEFTVNYDLVFLATGAFIIALFWLAYKIFWLIKLIRRGKGYSPENDLRIRN